MQRVQVDGAELAYTTRGPADGRPVVLLHAGVADRRLWDPVLDRLPPDVRAIAYDARGFGESTWGPGPSSPSGDLLALLDRLELERVDLAGCSVGAHTALEAAVVAPGRIGSVVALAPPLPDHPFSAALEAYGVAEESALEAGRVAEAVELNLRTWVDGPHRDTEDTVARRYVTAALTHALQAQGRTPLGDEVELEPPLTARLGDVTADVVLAVGELDQPDFVAIAARLVAALPRATLHRVPGAGHLLPLEAPDLVVRLIAGL